MAIIGVGIDIVDVERMKQALAAGTLGERFKRRVFTDDERAYCESRGVQAAQSYAARFAAKEAVQKAFGGRARSGFAWPDIEVIRLASGAPQIVLRGRMKQRAESMGASVIHVSLAHIQNVAVAHAVVERA